MSKFSKVTDFLEKHLVPRAAALGRNKYLSSVRDGMTLITPFVVIGSIFLILGSFPVEAVQNFLAPISDNMDQIVTITFGMVAIFSCLGISFRLAQKNNMGEMAISISATSLVVFFITMIGNNIIDTSGAAVEGALNIAYLGSESLFVSIAIAIITTEIMTYLVNKKITIKLPDTVPPAISQSFASLIPAGAVIFLFFFIQIIITKLGLLNIHDMVNTALAIPLKFVGDTWLGAMFMLFFTCLLWTFGLHGSAIVATIGDPIILKNTLHNAALAAKGLEPTMANGFHPYTDTYLNMSMNLGGTGTTFGFIFFALLWAKSSQIKEIGKIGLVPAFFNINEPIIFGAPIVLNPILMIPFIITPLITGSLTWFAMKTGLVAVPYAMVPWTTPPFINGLLSTGFRISPVILTAVNLVIITIIWFPFMKMYDKQLLQQEN